jgi:hypothetical protein
MVNNDRTKNNKSKHSKKNYKGIKKGKHANSKSVVTNIYTYEKKKPKRLGKTCIHFNIGKLTCDLSNLFCKDADNCTSYVTNLKTIQSKKNNVKNISNIDKVGVTTIVLTDNRKCTNEQHNVVDLNAIIRLVTQNGEILNYTISAGYCKECDTYFIFKRDYKIAKAMGKILCPIIDFTKHEKSKNNNGNISSSESRIHQLGYNVKRGSNYTKEQRQVILANIIENTNITKYEIESCITRPMLQHENQPNYAAAVLAWKEDLEFVKNYKIGDIPEVAVDKIIIGKRK